MTHFDGLQADMFAVYAPETWSSNVHNLTRRRNKECLLALGDRAAAGLTEELAGLSRAASDEIPGVVNRRRVEAQWVTWGRDAAARAALSSLVERTPLTGAAIFDIAPHDKHAALALALRRDGLWVGLRLAAGAVVDRRNLARRLDAAPGREALLALLAEMPAATGVGFEGDAVAVADVDAAALAACGPQLAACPAAWCVGLALEAAEAVALGAELADQVRRWLGTLAPLYRFVAWHADHDLIEVGRQLGQQRADQRRRAALYAAGDRVRVIAGPLTGRLGVVQESDARATVRLRVGPLSVVLAGTDLLPA